MRDFDLYFHRGLSIAEQHFLYLSEALDFIPKWCFLAITFALAIGWMCQYKNSKKALIALAGAESEVDIWRARCKREAMWRDASLIKTSEPMGIRTSEWDSSKTPLPLL